MHGTEKIYGIKFVPIVLNITFQKRTRICCEKEEKHAETENSELSSEIFIWSSNKHHSLLTVFANNGAASVFDYAFKVFVYTPQVYVCHSGTNISCG